MNDLGISNKWKEVPEIVRQCYIKKHNRTYKYPDNNILSCCNICDYFYLTETRK